jgi:acyl-coenzyme A thioesterase PaaI-like protein
MSARFSDNDFCFACGTKNPLGLQLQFIQSSDRLQTRFKPQPQWQGWVNVLHGGLQSAILDDLMSNHLFRLERVWAVTAELSLRFRHPVPLDQELLFESHLIKRSGKLWELGGECRVFEGDGMVLTTATGRFMEVARNA